MIKVSLPDISSKEVNEVKNILYSNWIVEGPKTKILEDKFKKDLKKNFVFFLIHGLQQLLHYLRF